MQEYREEKGKNPHFFLTETTFVGFGLNPRLKENHSAAVTDFTTLWIRSSVFFYFNSNFLPILVK